MVENGLRQCQKQRAQLNRMIQNFRRWVIYFKLKFCTLYLNLLICFNHFIYNHSAYVLSQVEYSRKGKGRKQQNTWLLDSFLFLLEKVDGCAFKGLFILAMIHDVIVVIQEGDTVKQEEEFRQIKHLWACLK